MPEELTVAAIFKNEASYLAEWVEFHRMQGVSRFLLYNHDSLDDYEKILEPYKQIVEVIPAVTLHNEPQQESYADALRRCQTGWLGVLDIDEFVFNPDGRTIPATLEDMKLVPPVIGVVVQWHQMQDSLEYRPEGLVIENYTIRQAENSRVHKSICRPQGVYSDWGPDAHLPWRDNDKKFVNAIGEPVMSSNALATEIYPGLRCNHYYSRSRAEWRIKVDKGGVCRTWPGYKPLTYEDYDKYNNQQGAQDTYILQYVPKLKEALNARYSESRGL